MAELQSQMRVILLHWGNMVTDINGMIRHGIHRPLISYHRFNAHFVSWDYTWYIVKIERIVCDLPRDLEAVYASHNVGLEGWCVFATDYDTLVNALIVQNEIHFRILP